MKPLTAVTGWTTFGMIGVAAITLGATPLLSEAAPSDDTTDAAVAAVDDDSTSTDSGDDTSASAHSSAETEPETDAETEPEPVAVPHECGDDDALDRARHLVHYERLNDADELLEGLLVHDCVDESNRDLARFQHAYVSHLRDRPEQTLHQLDELDGETPVDDYVLWLRGQALEQLERHSEAADAYFPIYDADDSPLHWYARARQSHALVEAQRWEEALEVVEQIVDTFPDYPRRHRALYHHAKVLENLGRLDDAAEAYQKAAFRFPYKQEGQAASRRLDALAHQGIEPSPIDPEKRYEQYRQLSIDKFWPLAHELLTDLRDEIADDGPPSQLENEILQRIALNTFHRHDFEGAAEYFGKAREIYEEGHTDGFNERTIYRYHNFSLARIGKIDEAREAMEELHDNSWRRRTRSIAKLYERYGHYEEAYQLFEQLYSSAQQRGWHFSYLKYKTGRFDEAYENLRRLARRSRGKTRSKYMYWAARSLERAGHDDRAAELFTEVHNARPDDYYGVQSANRLRDLNQRSTVDDTLLARADELSESYHVVHDAFDEVDRVRPAAYQHPRTDPRRQPRGSGIAEQSADPLWGNQVVAAIHDGNCDIGDNCPTALGLPFPTYGLTWNLGQPLIDPRAADTIQPATTRTEWDGADGGDDDEMTTSTDVAVTDGDIEFGTDTSRIRYHTEGRIYWAGRHDSDIEFASYKQGDMLGPSPDRWTAYADDTHHGGLDRAIDEAGELFPKLERVQWLWTAGWYPQARRIVRDVALEFRGITRRARPSSSPRELSYRRWQYHIDNRRRSERADFWGMEPARDELRFPVPDDSAERRELLQRQQQIYDQRRELQPLLVEALQEVGDYHMVRQFALGDTWWLREEPKGEALRHWRMAYPRAFPEQVIPLAEKHNVNPYMIWALMLVESSFNPDSISVADALGLLQVIPRTGLKIADLFGADDFGPFDLLEEEESIEQGIFYFSRLVQKFHSQELLAFAGYNGGPHRVRGWLDMRGHNMPLDEFVEEIPFDQSRNYAKKVLRFLHTYLTLYEGYDEGLYVGQNLRTDYLPQPDF